jgi:hypothetical protein
MAIKLMPVVWPSRKTLSLKGKELDEAIWNWFFSNFQAPSDYEERDGSNPYEFGGPYDASEIIQEAFGEADETIVDAVIEEIEAEGMEWAPDMGRLYDDDYQKNAHAKLQTSLDELEVALDAVETVSESIGGNKPPEEIGVPPYTDEDKIELKSSITILRQPDAVLFSQKAEAIEAANKIKSRAEGNSRISQKARRFSRR